MGTHKIYSGIQGIRDNISGSLYGDCHELLASNWANCARRPFCLLEVHLVPRLSSYWKLHLPQGLMGCICALRRFLFSFVCFYFPCGGKKTQTRSTKCTFKVTLFIFLKMLNVWNQLKLCGQIQAKREFSVWLNAEANPKKSVNPAHKTLWPWIFPATVFSFHFL